MPEILTRRIGPFPGWVWGALAGGGFIVFMYLRKRGQPGQQGQAQGSLVNNPAASSIPYVPSVTVTGIPSAPSPSPTTQGPSSGCSQPDTPVNRADWVQFQGTYWYKPGGQDAPFIKNCVMYSHILDQQSLNAYKAGGGQPYFFVQPGVPVPGEVGAIYTATPVATSGGSGGFGYAGAPGYGSAIGGWTVGWTPTAQPGMLSPGGGWGGSGAGSTVNRTGVRRSRRLFGGSGGGASRVRQQVRPLRRRNLSGR